MFIGETTVTAQSNNISGRANRQTMDSYALITTDMQPNPLPRRAKRRNSALDSPRKPRFEGDVDFKQVAIKTPGRRSKRVRFSDPSATPSTKRVSTGITPHLKRSSLGTPRTQRIDTAAVEPLDQSKFTPLRQVLDERVKRRIRRNGLSEEQNEYEADKRANIALQKQIDAKDEELQKLKVELAAAQSGRDKINDAFCIPPASQERVDEVAAELEALRQSFALEESAPVASWNHIPLGVKGPSSEGGDTIQIYEDEDADQPNADALDADSLAMGLELEAAKQAKKSFLGSFRESTSFTEINFADSPARRQNKAVGTSPRTPRTFYHDLSKQLKTATNRAEEAELALKSLESEVVSLGFVQEPTSGLDVVASIADHFRKARLELEHTLPGETVIGFENSKVLPEVISKLRLLAKQVRNKEVELKTAQDQQRNLKGNFEKAIIAAEKATSRIRDLEASIDVTAEEMLNLRIRSQNLEKDLAEKEQDNQALSTALDKYRSDVSRLEALITNLESSHALTLDNKAQTISNLEARVAAETRGRRAAETSAVSRLAKISELESALSTAESRAESVEEAMSKLQSYVDSSSTSHSQEIGSLNVRLSNLSTALASANAEVEKLKVIKMRLEQRVHEEMQQATFTVEAMQARLIKSVFGNNEDKKSYIRGSKVRQGNYEIEADGLESDGIEPLTPASLVRFSEFSEEFHLDVNQPRTPTQDTMVEDESEFPVPSTVEIGRGRSNKERSRSAERRKGLSIRKPRHSYDSGIGMSSGIDLGSDDGYESTGILTPDLSSDADNDVEAGFSGLGQPQAKIDVEMME